MNQNHSDYQFVDDEESAHKRFLEFSSKDPLPDVPPALLNSGDIYDYACITSMVFPFDKNNDRKKLKSASYEIDFLGYVSCVNEETGKVETTKIKNRKLFTLRKNSIAFLYTETKFFLPNYIAIRFNLKITHVHRGLLLGTGPLVDPGFVGRLLIPLHNLTSEDYIIKGGDGLIWVEFTKLSPHRSWSQIARRNSADYISFPSRKIDLPIEEYFIKASSTGKPANSSIPGEVASAKDMAHRTLSIVTYVGGIGVLGFLALLFMTWDLISNANQHIAVARDEAKSLRGEHFQSTLKIHSLEAQIKYLTKTSRNKEKNSSENLKERYEQKETDSVDSSD